MDETDEAITALLEVDGRLTHREIAQRLGLSRSATASRVQRLLTNGQVVVRGVVHPTVIGRGSLAHVGLSLTGPAATVAAQLTGREDIPFVSMTSGQHGVVAEVRTASFDEIDKTITHLRSIVGVAAVDTLIYVEVIRDVVGPVGTITVAIDDIDIAVLRALQEDGRASYVDLASAVGLSPAGVRRRVIRLREARVVRIGAVVRHSGRDRQSAMGFGVKLSGEPSRVVAAIAAMSSAIFIVRTVGRFDLLVTMRASSTAQLSALLDEVRALPGVVALESWTHLNVVKETYASGMEVPPTRGS